MNLYQAVLFGLLQGVTELFPISSLGHSVILPKMLNWNINQNSPFFLTFLVATHAATALVLFLFFRTDWHRIIKGLVRSFRQREIKKGDKDAKLGWLLVVSTIPAGILGLLFEQTFKQLFANPTLVAKVLVLNGILLFAAETLRKKRVEHNSPSGSDERIARLNFGQAIKVGLLQCIALVPGFSRTGATLTGGLLVGLSHEDAARFSFLLATPIIGAASVLKLPELLDKTEQAFVLPILVGTVSSGIAAYFSVKFLTRYFQTKKLTPFAIYCVLVGTVVSLIFLLR